jgi:hypothetical protein
MPWRPAGAFGYATRRLLPHEPLEILVQFAEKPRLARPGVSAIARRPLFVVENGIWFALWYHRCGDGTFLENPERFVPASDSVK